MDFGCYGANLVTWLGNGQRPISVTAVTQQLQKENNPNVANMANQQRNSAQQGDSQGLVQENVWLNQKIEELSSELKHKTKQIHDMRKHYN